MSNIIKTAIKKILSNPLLIPLSVFFSIRYRGIGSIVMFHRVVKEEGDIACGDIEITEYYLEKTIDYFANRGYRFVSLDELHDVLLGKKNKKKLVAFTFDDGYVDNYTVAYPMFKKHNIPFAIYVTTSFPERRAKLWWYALREMIDENDSIEYEFKHQRHTFETSTGMDKKNAYRLIRKMILSLNGEEQESFTAYLFEKYDIKLDDYVHKLSLSWEQIRILAHDELVTIGAHTSNHYNLKALDEAAMKNEIEESKKKIESMTGRHVAHFAYPFGSKNEADKREFDMVKTIGFKTATTTRCGNIHLEHSNRLEALPRISPGLYSLSPFINLYVNGLIPACVNRFRRVV